MFKKVSKILLCAIAINIIPSFALASEQAQQPAQTAPAVKQETQVKETKKVEKQKQKKAPHWQVRRRNSELVRGLFGGIVSGVIVNSRNY